MPALTCQPTKWKGRSAYTLSNGTLQVTMLLVGGHIAEVSHSDAAVNALWEAPWKTIEPTLFNDAEHGSRFGRNAAGHFLSGFTGHALVVGYFGMPSSEEESAGLPLHGEAAVLPWTVVSASDGPPTAELVLACELPAYGLEVRRSLALGQDASAVCVSESIRNLRDADRYIQWVQHVTLGPPFFAPAEATLSVPADRGMSWSLGYEGRPALEDDREFTWPLAPAHAGGVLDLSRPFAADKTGLVTALHLAETAAADSFIAAVNHRFNLVLGYTFDRKRFPWVVLWQENCVRSYAPWNGITRALGVEFGTSPMPLGLQQAVESAPLFATNAVLRMPARATVATTYEIFLDHSPAKARTIQTVKRNPAELLMRCDNGEVVRVRK